MALRGRRTRTVRMADRLMFCRSREYSTILEEEGRRRGTQRDETKVTGQTEDYHDSGWTGDHRSVSPSTIAAMLNASIAALPRRFRDELTKHERRRIT